MRHFLCPAVTEQFDPFDVEPRFHAPPVLNALHPLGYPALHLAHERHLVVTETGHARPRRRLARSPREANDLPRGRPAKRNGRHAAEDLLVRLAELGAERHVDDEVYRRVHRLQKVGDARDAHVEVAIAPQPRVLAPDLRARAVDGAGQDAEHEDERHDEQHHRDPVLLVLLAAVAVLAHDAPQVPRLADRRDDEHVEDDEHRARHEAEEDVEEDPVDGEELRVAPQRRHGQLEDGVGLVVDRHLSVRGGVLQGQRDEGHGRYGVDDENGHARQPLAADCFRFHRAVNGDEAVHAEHACEPGGDSGGDHAPVRTQDRVGQDAQVVSPDGVARLVDVDDGEPEAVRQEEQVGEGQRGQAVVGRVAHSVVHQDDDAHDVAHRSEQRKHRDEDHAEDEQKLPYGTLRHEDLLVMRMKNGQLRRVRGDEVGVVDVTLVQVYPSGAVVISKVVKFVEHFA